jgi:deoxycytidylate deaminase
MYNAVSAASKSACLSRQVGAAIYSQSGELIGVGWNDVPKAKGGLYGHEDLDSDHRCYRWGGKICHNDDRKEKLYQKIAVELRRDKLVDEGKFDQIRRALTATEIRNLIEYSRSVHAEMEAIISVARAGKSGISGATMYTTTFPCHSCARHIVAAGILKVFYIEPYPKSLAMELHDDAISTRSSEAGGKVVFLQYEGVAPKNVIRLFKSDAERKERGAAVFLDRRKAEPIFKPAMDGFAAHEQMVVKEVHEKEKQLAKNRDK